MNAPTTSAVPAPRRRRWPWVLAIGLSPFLILALAAASYLTLDRDAAALRRHVVAATQAKWDTKVQLSVGRFTIGATCLALRLASNSEAATAAQALAAVKHASVGVYELTSGPLALSREQFFGETDRAMRARGWSRLVGVADQHDNVLIYVEDEADADEPLGLCLAVVSQRELVVVSTSIEAAELSGLLQEHLPTELRAKLSRSTKAL